MNNQEEKQIYKNKKAEKESEKNVTEDVIYDELFIAKTSMQHHDRKILIVHSGNTSHMVNLKGNMKTLKDTKI